MGDRYREVAKLGSGGFGEVTSVRRVGEKTLFARKTLQLDDEAALKRFAREVRILSSLDHPNIVRVIDQQLDAEPCYYVMPLYDHSLASELGSLVGDESRVGTIFRAILDAMEYAHAQGVIHRDLKPENVLMNSDTDLVVSDFGLGRRIDAATTRQTMSGIGMGTPWYMAPEQLYDFKNADQRSDIFSLGRILYELHTGPILSSVQDTSQLPLGVRQVVTRCTQSSPERRFQAVTDLKKAWTLLMGTTSRETDRAEFERLRAEIASATTIDDGKLERLIELLARFASDRDLLHKTVMQLPAGVFAAAFRAEPEEVTRLIDGFVEFTAEQSWGFEYTDEIADVCRSLHAAIPDPELRAALIACTLTVGIGHNRWHVLGVFGELASAKLTRAEELALVTRLGELDDWTREHGARYVESAISPAVAELFAPKGSA
jgi:eukaryotic-like serine/threonine-protein kinase